MYDQSYIDNLPTMKVADVLKLKKAKRLEIKHFKCGRGCIFCGCLVRTISSNTGNSECSKCLKTFKGLDLPVRKPTKVTVTNRGLNTVKRSPFTVGGVNARITKNENFTRYMSSSWNWSGIPVVFSGMNTGG